MELPNAAELVALTPKANELSVQVNKAETPKVKEYKVTEYFRTGIVGVEAEQIDSWRIL